MVAKHYMRCVNYRLRLPPWYRLRELNALAGEIREYEQNNGVCMELEKVLGSPEEKVEQIQYRYPFYESSPLRILPLFLAIVCGIGFLVQFITKITYMRRSYLGLAFVKALGVPEYLFSSEYVIHPEKAVTAAPVHSPEEIMLFCGIGVIVGLALYLWLSYVPKK